MRRLYLYANQLSGAIPAQLGTLASLLELYLFNNRLSGAIPSQLGNLVRLRALLFGSNKLVGTILSSLANLTGLITGNLDLHWNALYSADASLVSFLNSKQSGGDWESTQTIAPSNVSATPQSSSSVTLSWTPILYAADSGRYEVLQSTASTGPYTQAGSTSTKSASGIDVTGLTPGTTYYFVVQAATDPHADNQNTVASEASREVSSTTPAPVLNFSTTSLTFADQLVGTTSPSQTVTLTNPGTAAVTVSSISVTGNFQGQTTVAVASLRERLARSRSVSLPRPWNSRPGRRRSRATRRAVRMRCLCRERVLLRWRSFQLPVFASAINS